MPHIHDKYDFVVTAGIVYQDKVLLIKHRKLNLWLAPGGHIELDENPLQALYREVNEEVGYSSDQLLLLGNDKLPLPVISEGLQVAAPLDIHVHTVGGGHSHIALIYGFIVDNPDFIHHKGEHSQTKWFTRTELKNSQSNLPPNVYAHSVFILDLAQKGTKK